jgi:hypothetical protein
MNKSLWNTLQNSHKKLLYDSLIERGKYFKNKTRIIYTTKYAMQ